MGLNEYKNHGNFLSIVQGTFRMKTDKENPKAVKREWEKDGQTGTKYELVYESFSGIITAIDFFDGDFGEQLVIKVEDDGKRYIINVPSESRYANDFMKRAKGINFTKEVELKPYDVDNDGKRNQGIKVTQGSEVIGNQYWDAGLKKLLGGFPEMDVDQPDKDDWKIYFVKVRKFLKSEMGKLKFNTMAQELAKPITTSTDADDDLPF